MEIYATDQNSTTMSASHDDWLLNFDSVERNRQRKAAAKRAKSFSLACKPENRSHAEYNQWHQPEAGPRVSGRHYAKAVNYNPTAMPHNRQSYADGMEHRYVQRRPFDIYSGGDQSGFLHGLTSYQPVSTADYAADRRFPFKSSCSNLSDQYSSQDSAYHSRHGSSIDATDPNSVGSDVRLGSGRGLVRARFPSCPNADPQSFTTHTEEIVSPRTARRIFEEAATRNSGPMRDRTYSKMTFSPSESCLGVHRQSQEVRRSCGGSGSPRIDSVSGQPQRTKSFSAVWSEPSNLSSMTHVKVKQYDRQREWSVGDGQCIKASATPLRSRLFYNTTTQTEPEELLGGDVAIPFTNKQWFDAGNLARGNNRDSDTGGPNTSPKKFSNEFTGNFIPEDRSDVGTMPKKFTSDQATQAFTGSQELGYVRCSADASQSGGSNQDPGRTYSANQAASRMRRLSKELYGQKLGPGLSSWKSFSGDRHARLGSIDENSQSFESPERNLGCRRKSSSEVERHSRRSSRDAGSQPNDSEKAGDDDDDDDDDDDLGDGRNFVRNRKPQMSLRKAFGIYDEFETSEGSLRDHMPLAKQSLAQFGNSKPLHDVSMDRKGSESCGIDEGFTKSLPPSSFEAGWQGNSFVIDTALAPSRSFAAFQPRSSVPEVTRLKSASMPCHQTFSLMSSTGGNASYTGTGVPLTRHSNTSQDDLQCQRTAGQQERCLSEVHGSVVESGYSGGFGGQSLIAPVSSGVYDDSHSPRDDFPDDVPADDSSSHSSTPPPVLPPRRYRKGSARDVWTGSPGDELVPNVSERHSGASADFDAESTIKRDSYAHQLRQRSHRLSHSVGGSSYLHRRPPPPLTSVNTDESNDQGEAHWSPVARSACVSGNQSLPAFQCFEKSPLQKNFSGSGHAASPSWCHVPDQSCETPRTFQSTASITVSGTFNEVSTNRVSSVELDDSFSMLPSSRHNVHHNSDSSEAVAEPSDGFRFCGAIGASDGAYSPPARTRRVDLETNGDARNICDDSEAEAAKTEHYRTSSTRKSGERTKKADMAVVQPSVRSGESAVEKCASSTGSETNKGPSPSKVGKVRGYPRPPGKSPDESAYDCAAAVAPPKLPYEEKSSFESSAYETPATVVGARMPEGEIASSGSFGSVSFDARRSQTDGAQAPDGRLPEDGRPGLERELRERPRSLAIPHSPEEPRRPTGTILPSPQQQQQQHRTTADYMTDLFTKEEDGSTVQSDSLTRNSFQRASLRHRLMTTKQTMSGREHVTVLPEEDLPIMDRLSQILQNLDDITEISEEEKLNLIIVLEKKLCGLHEEKQLLNDEIAENNALGKLVTTVVERKLSVKEFDKYRSYVDELEKMLYLILKLSERLAKAENAVQALPQNANDKEKAALISKRNELSEKHADALTLKEGIDRRRHQVDTYLRNCLSHDELKDYEYFVKMKAQLVIDRQDVEDRIEMRRRYLELFKSTVNGGCESKSDYYGPKSYC